MYVAEEQQNVASYINFCPKNERFQYLLMLKPPFFKKLMDRMEGRVSGLSFAECRKHFFDTLKLPQGPCPCGRLFDMNISCSGAMSVLRSTGQMLSL